MVVSLSKKRKNRKARNRKVITKLRVSRTTDVHHYYWEKKWYRHNVLIEVDYDFHHSYHAYFTANCTRWVHRQCMQTDCIYQPICCYCEVELDFGKRVPQDKLLELAN